MQTTSELYKTLLSDPRHTFETKVTIGEDVYGMDRIVSLETSGSLYSQESLSAGGTCAREFDLLIREPGTIPRAALLSVHVRAVSGDQASEWIPKGIYRIDTRETDAATGVLTIHGFDRMLETEQVFTFSPEQDWPMTETECVTMICDQCGLELDPRSPALKDYPVQYPTDGTTCRELLGWIAGENAGNWTMTDTGKLRLVRIMDTPAGAEALADEDYNPLLFGQTVIRLDNDEEINDQGHGKTDVGMDAAEASVPFEMPPITGVRVSTSEEAGFLAGDETGNVLDVYHPDGNQQLADDLLATVKGYVYRPVMATSALLDPAAEFGDAIIIDGVNSVLASLVTYYDLLMTADAGSPGKREAENEYGSFKGPEQKEWQRRFDGLHSAIERTQGEIKAYVEDTLNGALAQIDIKIDNILLSVQNELTQQMAQIDIKLNAITLSVQDQIKEAMSSITINPDSIDLRVVQGDTSAEIQILVDGTVASRGTIAISGNLNVSGELSAEALYSDFGDIADLQVDKLSTSRRILLYLKKDKSDDNFIRIHDQTLEFVTGSTDGTTTEQARNPYSRPLYWETDITDCKYNDAGWPVREDGAQRIFMTTEDTGFPVTVYVYKDYVKRSISFKDDGDGYYTPYDYIGAGDGTGGSIGRIVKKPNGMEVMYLTGAKKDIGLRIGVNGDYVDVVGARKTTALDFSAWDMGSFTESVDGIAGASRYSVQFDAEGRPVTITDADMHSITITW